MSQVRSRSGFAVPTARLWRSLTVAVAALASGSVSHLHAQFPAPARPPKAQVEAAQSEAAKTPAKLPAARSILDRHLAAIGGRDAVLGHSSTHATGTLSMPSAGLTGSLEIYGAKPNKTLLKISLGGVGEVVEGFDGKYGWSISPMTGPMILEGKQLAEKQFDSEFHSELRSDSRYASLTTLEQVDFEGRSCYKVRLVKKTGGEDLEFYDVQTGLRAGTMTTRETQMGTVSGTTVEADYRKFGNLLQPSTIRSQIGGVQQVITITAVEYDNVPATVFDMPAGIKALLK